MQYSRWSGSQKDRHAPFPSFVISNRSIVQLPQTSFFSWHHHTLYFVSPPLPMRVIGFQLVPVRQTKVLVQAAIFNVIPIILDQNLIGWVSWSVKFPGSQTEISRKVVLSFGLINAEPTILPWWIGCINCATRISNLELIFESRDYGLPVISPFFCSL